MAETLTFENFNIADGDIQAIGWRQAQERGVVGDIALAFGGSAHDVSTLLSEVAPHKDLKENIAFAHETLSDPKVQKKLGYQPGTNPHQIGHDWAERSGLQTEVFRPFMEPVSGETPEDFDASLAFYRDVLGWSVTSEWGGHGTGRGVALSGGGVKVVIGERESESTAEEGLGSSRPNVHLDIHDVDARFKKLPAGTHVLTLYGLEDCCSGNEQAQFRIGDGEFVSLGNHDGLQPVPETQGAALLLAGLVLVGTLARRSQDRGASPRALEGAAVPAGVSS